MQTIASVRASHGGPSRTVIELSKALGQCDDTRVSILTADRDMDVELGVPTNADRSPLLVSSSGSLLHRLRTLAGRAAGPSVIHDNGVWLWSNVQAAIAARTLGIPAVISPQGCLEQWSLRHNRWRKRAALLLYQRRCLSNAAAFHATSVLEAQNVRALGLRQPIAVIANGIEAPPPSASTAAAPSTPRRVALFLSRLHKKKGVLELIEAWASLRPRGWGLHIVGPDEGGYRQRLVDAIALHGLHDSVELHGEASNDQKWGYYRQAQLFVLPTYTENFGLVIGEALACGVPVITTTETPWTEIANRGCGWVVPPKQDALRQALAQATSASPERLAEMGAVGRAWIPDAFSWTSVAERMRQLYAWIADGARPSRTPAFVMRD